MPGPVAERSFTAGPGSWRFAEAGPAPALMGRVLAFWEVEGALAPFREAVLPNGCVELMINLGPPHRLLGPQGERTWTGSWFSGLQERALHIESLEGTHLVSARLHPVGAAVLLGEAAPRAANRVVELDEVAGDGARALAARVRAARDTAERFATLESFLLARLASPSPVPPFVADAAAALEREPGRAVASLHAAAGVSRKHLSVSFTRWVGVSARSYARIHRFVRALGRIGELASVDWARLAAETGYADQSHLVRDFRRIGAATPTEYLRRVSPDGTALLHDADVAAPAR